MNDSDVLKEKSLQYHSSSPKGKIAVSVTKPCSTKQDLSLAYSPGVAFPCMSIKEDAENAYLYTAKGNTVAIVTNGSAVLGLGNIGALASKPVMEGKAALFKKFANIDAYDIEVNTSNVDDFVKTVSLISTGWGGINLEDIRAPECFIIEERLKQEVDIPVFHDDQHGTAIVVLAGLINALDIQGKSLESAKIVINGAGAAGIACADLLVKAGVSKSNLIICDSKGVIHSDRQDLNFWKARYAIDTKKRFLSEAVLDSDVFIGLSVKGVLTTKMVLSMQKKPIIFALANPDPEILPEVVKSVLPDAIISTGRSDYPNQINNVLCFPFLFRGVLDARAKDITDAMKIAAAYAISGLARNPISSDIIYGPDHIIPSVFDTRLIESVSSAVAQAAAQ
ncbi:malic enzyme-like NAD(P)-binding protein [Candidatus Sneabacter namystus]|uniref:Malate dehydrogenase n=1 Tax=Candidatus Sneabacter namystus TaxID=2601646 RepID=A0A5C0UI81_9RICK|nr:malic enzyme-like NAD(P)-binding protein [Candidatus Sneabacter namystus]QEK39786.1 malate dehydrogenase [Candidatus Sneabacter namystus]